MCSDRGDGRSFGPFARSHDPSAVTGFSQYLGVYERPILIPGALKHHASIGPNIGTETD
jgi:hypothetical protein